MGRYIDRQTDCWIVVSADGQGQADMDGRTGQQRNKTADWQMNRQTGRQTDRLKESKHALLIAHLHWQSLLAKLSMTATRNSHMTVTTVLALATLGSAIQIGSILFKLRRLKWPGQVGRRCPVVISEALSLALSRKTSPM